jgi:hypothetical protein
MIGRHTQMMKERRERRRVESKVIPCVKRKIKVFVSINLRGLFFTTPCLPGVTSSHGQRQGEETMGVGDGRKKGGREGVRERQVKV